MTNEQKVEVYRMRLNGATLQECADKFGVTREYIRQITPAVRGNRRCFKVCIYPGVAKWLEDNDWTFSQLADKSGVSVAALETFLTGRGGTSKRTIDRLLEITGMTYEEAFK